MTMISPFLAAVAAPTGTSLVAGLVFVLATVVCGKLASDLALVVDAGAWCAGGVTENKDGPPLERVQESHNIKIDSENTTHKIVRLISI
jgi:hypothetical protein